MYCVLSGSLPAAFMLVTDRRSRGVGFLRPLGILPWRASCRIRRVIVWNVRTSVCELAIGDKAQAGHHRLFVNVKIATSPMQQLHLIPPGCAVVVALR